MKYIGSDRSIHIFSNAEAILVVGEADGNTALGHALELAALGLCII